MRNFDRWAVLASLVLLFVTLAAFLPHFEFSHSFRNALPWLVVGWVFFCFGGCGRRGRCRRRASAEAEAA